MMAAPQDWAPYYGLEDAAKVYLRDPMVALTDTDYFCESFRYDKSVDNGGLAQMERLLQFGRVLSRSM